MQLKVTFKIEAMTSSEFDIPMYLGHLRVAELLVNYDSLDELCVLQLASNLALHLDELKIYILPFHVSHSEDGIHCDLCHLPVAPVDAKRQQHNFVNILAVLSGTGVVK